MDKAEQLADEIRQIIEQYRQEVSTTRRTWPLSVKERVIELKKLGFSSREVFRKTGVPEPTVWLWTTNRPIRRKSKKREFIPVQVNSTVKSLTVKGPVGSEASSLGGFLVELPGGLKIRNIDLEALIELSRRMSQ